MQRARSLRAALRRDRGQTLARFARPVASHHLAIQIEDLILQQPILFDQAHHRATGDACNPGIFASDNQIRAGRGSRSWPCIVSVIPSPYLWFNNWYSFESIEGPASFGIWHNI